jgi:hypothetical protein
MSLDICTAAGSTTDPGLQAQPPRVIPQKLMIKVRQGLLGSLAVWRQFLKPYTCDSTSNRLRQTLGPWKGLTSEMACILRLHLADALPGTPR